MTNVTLKNLVSSEYVRANTAQGARVISDAEMATLKLYEMADTSQWGDREIETESGEWIHCVGDGSCWMDGRAVTPIMRLARFELDEDGEWNMIESESLPVFVECDDLNS